MVSMCHWAFGAYFAAIETIFEATSDLNSVGQVSKKIRISLMVPEKYDKKGSRWVYLYHLHFVH